MFSLRNIASAIPLLLSVHPAIGTEFANLSPGCDGPEQVLSSARGCVSITHARLMLVSTSSTTGHPDPDGIVVFIYTGDSCDGGHAALDQGSCYETTGFHSARVLYLPDEESTSDGDKLVPESSLRLDYSRSISSDDREDRHRRINGYESTQKAMLSPTKEELG
ncbi:hypothetical protein BKA65DRAFT_575351 [Rhexocercosporidium sp. MPI-PUGE-AT-0058]|nr:hypothetical protein BKA65DRAFT_575351 [Rhexocercosporidium sp. MPI-PUGE-AT-0058]